MRKNDWLIWVLFTATAVGLRVLQMNAGFEETGLAKRGFLPGLLLPAVLFAAAICFGMRARSLPGIRPDVLRLKADFCFWDNIPAILCVVAGSFLVLIGCGLYVLSASVSLFPLLLVLLGIAAAASVLHVVFALYRGSEVQNLALLVPICALIVLFIYIYRTDALDPVLAHIYIEILALAALLSSFVQLAAFVFGGSAPRRYVPLSAAAALLSLVAASEGGGLARAAVFIGCGAVVLGFLAAADFNT